MKEDERKLLLAILAIQRPAGSWRKSGDQWPRDAIRNIGIHYKRCWYLLNKWAGRLDWYEYGVCLDLGWLTPKGIAAALALSECVNKDPK